MREIKFKAVYENKIWDVYAIDWSERQIISAHLYDGKETIKVYPSDIGDDVVFLQYTGLRDFSKKELFDGDLFRDDFIILEGMSKYHAQELTKAYQAGQKDMVEKILELLPKHRIPGHSTANGGIDEAIKQLKQKLEEIGRDNK